MTLLRPHFIPNPALQSREGHFTVIEIDTAQALRSWQRSLFSYEWLTPDGSIKEKEALAPAEREKRRQVEEAVAAGQPLPMPVLGIGIMDNIEIGSGRAEFLTLAAQGRRFLSVHIPKSNLADFKPFLAQTAKAESGNALLYILIAVILLAALSLAVAQSGRGNINQVSAEKIKLYASELIDYSNAVANAVTQLRLRGCKDTALSFENPAVSGYINGSAPSDKSCHIFDPAGGGINWKIMPSEFLGNHTALSSLKGSVDFTGNVEIQESASASGDLVMHVDILKKAVCLKINDLLHIANPGGDAPTDALAAEGTVTKFTGSYVTSSTNIIGDNAAEFTRAKAGCRHVVNGGEDAYFFYRLLIAR